MITLGNKINFFLNEDKINDNINQKLIKELKDKIQNNNESGAKDVLKKLKKQKETLSSIQKEEIKDLAEQANLFF